jgi:ABC-type phosphate/phosphonate transport system substrate-binding protein
VIAELGMYSFASTVAAWDALWSAVHTRASWTPPTLAHSGDVHARWADADCVVNQVCGWPLMRSHRVDHAVVGSFALAIPGAEGHSYRSALLSSRGVPLAELTRPGTVAAVNGVDSLSGWVSLLHATVGADGAWPGDIDVTGSHHESLRRLAAGRADVASIDAWTLALIAADDPGLVAGLHRIGDGPLVPVPPITIRRALGDRRRAELAEAFADAIASPTLSTVRDTLHIAGFVASDETDYEPVLALARV